MSHAKELLGASRNDAFLISEEMSAAQLRGLDLKLVQSFKRTGSSIEVKFADLAKLCEIADRADLAEREAELGGAGAMRMRELMGIAEQAADEDDDVDDE